MKPVYYQLKRTIDVLGEFEKNNKLVLKIKHLAIYNHNVKFEVLKPIKTVKMQRKIYFRMFM